MSNLKRNLYRVSYIIDERALHDTLVKLATANALNVEVSPVTPPAADDSAAPAPTKRAKAPKAAAEKSNGAAAPSAKAAILAAAHAAHGGRLVASQLIEAHPQLSKGSVHQALFQLAAEKTLRRIKPGIYVANARALTKAVKNAKPPRATKAKAIRQPGASALVLELLEAAPGNKLTKEEITHAFGARGRNTSASAIEAAIYRNKKKLKHVGDAYELRG